jgi:hypothetical protein
MRPSAPLVVLALALLWANAALPAAQTPRMRHASGQAVVPVFEGWHENPDGTFSLSFGYMNRNFSEQLDIPVGPGNRLEPGPADRGQPTYFLPRRHTGVFTVVVPKDFGDRRLAWTITANGHTHSVPGHLRKEWKIDALKKVTNGNTPPVVTLEAAGTPIQGPGGGRTALRTSVGVPLALSVHVTDDMIRDRVGGGARQDGPRQLGVTWSKYRGPGSVTFTELSPAIDAAGRATTTATFSEPGEYVLHVLAWDDSGPLARGVMAVGFQCCWTNGYADVMVQRADRQRR